MGISLKVLERREVVENVVGVEMNAVVLLSLATHVSLSILARKTASTPKCLWASSTVWHKVHTSIWDVLT